MKTKLLKMAYGMFFLLALLITATVDAQTIANEDFEYEVGTNFLGQSGSGIGWAGPWYKIDNEFNLYTNVIAGNLNGIKGATGTVGGGWAQCYRDLSDPIIINSGNEIWIAFTISGNMQNTAGASFKNGSSESLFMGIRPNNLASLGDVFQDAGCVGPKENANGKTILSDAANNFISKVSGMGNGIIKIDLWVDYNGATEPIADKLEPTYQVSGYRKDVYGIDKINLLGNIGPNEDVDMKMTTYDAIRISYSFFQDGGNLLDNVPLELTSLTAKSTASGNSVSWTSASSKNVDYLEVLRKNEAGNFVVVSSKLSATATSFTDSNPLDGTNYYKLRSTDKDGSSKTYDLVATATGFDTQASFYPNPVTNGELNIVAGKESLKSVSIFDLLGKKVAFKLADGKTTKINTQGLAKGVYILEVNGIKSTSRKKLVIN